MVGPLDLQDCCSVADLIRNKFNKEEFSKYVNIMACDFVDHLNDVCDIMCSDEESIDDYVNEPMG